jgi:hypothetical protein
MLGAASPAAADSATISYTTTTGVSDPVTGVSRIVTLTATSTTPTRVWAKYRATGGAPCGASAYSDSGTPLSGFSSGFYGATVNGTVNLKGAGVWTHPPGSYAFCIWLSNTESGVATPFTQTITFRRATGTVTATIAPIAPRINEPATITITGATEAPAYAYGTYRPAGGPACAPTYSSDPGTAFVSSASVNGAFSLAYQRQFSTPGNYVLCLWVADSGSDPNPLAGPQPQFFTVTAPPTLVPTSSSLRRRGTRYSGKLVTGAGCRFNRDVVLRRVGRGLKSFGRARTRPDGSFTIRRSSRAGGRVYVAVAGVTKAQVICKSGKSPRIKG